jgi:hypothetical protein
VPHRQKRGDNGGAGESGGGVSEREKKVEEERRRLEAAGWEPRGRGPKTLWRNPADGRWYAQYRAITILRRQRRSMEQESGP